MNIKKIVGICVLILLFIMKTNLLYAESIPVVYSYDEFKVFIKEAILSQKPRFEVVINDYSEDIYSLDILLKELESSTPEVSYLFQESLNGTIMGFNNSSTRTMKMDLRYKNNKENLSNMYVANSVEDLSKIIKYSFQKYQPSILLKVFNYSPEKYNIGDIIEEVVIDNPQFKTGYQKVSSIYYGKGTNIIIEMKYVFSYDIEKIKEMREASDVAAKNIIDKIIKPEMPDYQKEFLIHNYIVNNSSYDIKNLEKNTIPEESYCMYGVLIKKTAVCEGYAATMKELLNLAGIEAHIVIGTGKGESHAWNIVKIQGKYYQVDVTWDDPVSSSGEQFLSYDYYNITDSEMKKDHKWDVTKYPACVDTKFNYINTLSAIENISEVSLINTSGLNDKTVSTSDSKTDSTTQTKTIGITDSKSSSITDINNSSITDKNLDSTANNTSINSNNGATNVDSIKYSTIIKLVLGNKLFQINDMFKEIDPGRDVVPVIVEGRTLVPVRVIVEALKGQILWDWTTSTVTIKRNDVLIALKIGDRNVNVSGKNIKIDVPATIINGRTFVPLRVISENLGCRLDWNAQKSEISIYSVT